MSTVQWKRTDDQIPFYLRILYSDDTRSPLGCACKSRKDPDVLVRQPPAVRLDRRIELAVPLAGRPRHQQRTGPREHGADPARAVLAQRAEALLRAEGFSRLVLDNEQQGDLIKLILSQEIDRPASALIEDVADGWPIIL